MVSGVALGYTALLEFCFVFRPDCNSVGSNQRGILTWTSTSGPLFCADCAVAGVFSFDGELSALVGYVGGEASEEALYAAENHGFCLVKDGGERLDVCCNSDD